MKILVVEDDKKIAKFLKRGLEEEGYEVDVAHDGEDVRIGGHEDRGSDLNNQLFLSEVEI